MKLKDLKEKYGKYFKFENTINGTDYFLRGTFGFILFFIPLSILFGISFYLTTIIGSSNAIFVLIFGLVIVLLELLVVILMFWFLFATTYKRINAFFNQNVGLLTTCTYIYSLIIQVLNPNNEIIQESITVGYTTHLILFIPSLVWGLYLTFGNSTIGRKNHTG
jgi:hypothetical protein